MPFDMTGNGGGGGTCSRCSGEAFYFEEVPILFRKDEFPSCGAILKLVPCSVCNPTGHLDGRCPFCLGGGLQRRMTMLLCGSASFLRVYENAAPCLACASKSP